MKKYFPSRVSPEQLTLFIHRELELIARAHNAFGSLDDLTDVVITSPLTGEVLVFDGTNWVNGNVTNGPDEFSVLLMGG